MFIRQYTVFGFFITILLVFASACTVSQTNPNDTIEGQNNFNAGIVNENGFTEFLGIIPPYSTNSFGTPVNLVNNPYAIDPTWEQLVAFIKIDPTDQTPYIDNFNMCGSFAETIHNNAEAAGIKAAWVSIDFKNDSEGHAANAFYVLNQGLVFIDCTGGNLINTLDWIDSSGAITKHGVDSYDKIAYIQLNKEYGLISLDYADSPDYIFFEAYIKLYDEYDIKLAEYNQEAEEYSTALGGRTSLPEPDYSFFINWYNQLNTMFDELNLLHTQIGDCTWENLGTVSVVDIYW